MLQPCWELLLFHPPRFSSIPSFPVYLWHWDLWCPSPPNYLFVFVYCATNPLKTSGLCLLDPVQPLPCSIRFPAFGINRNTC